MQRVRSTLTAILILIAGSLVTSAQTSKGTVVGTLLDPNGAAVGGATVKITNAATGVSRETTTTTEGTYRFEAVDPGDYKLEITAAGFKAISRGNVIASGGQITDYPFTLEVGNPTEV